MDHSTTQQQGTLVEINQELIKDHLGEMVRSTVRCLSRKLTRFSGGGF